MVCICAWRINVQKRPYDQTLGLEKFMFSSFRVSKWDIILMCDYGYEKKSILKNIIPSLYLNVFGDGR
jgi:hypothetical protein